MSGWPKAGSLGLRGGMSMGGASVSVEGPVLLHAECASGISKALFCSDAAESRTNQ